MNKLELTWTYFKYLLVSIFSTNGFAIKIIVGIVAVVFGDITRPVYAGIFSLWLFDMIIGLALMMKNKEKFNGSTFFFGLLKLLVYYCLLGAIWHAEVLVPFLGIGTIIGAIVIGCIVGKELSSIVKNAGEYSNIRWLKKLSAHIDKQTDYALEKMMKKISIEYDENGEKKDAPAIKKPAP